MTEEEIILEQSVEIPTIPVKPGGGEEECPVCLEQFNQVYKQASFTLLNNGIWAKNGKRENNWIWET
jgi:hypothetical protein